MIRRLTMISFLLATTAAIATPDPGCHFETVAAGSWKIGQWVDKSNWLTIENQRVSLQAAEVFMPLLRLQPAPGSEVLRAAPRLLDIEKIDVTDPLDGRKRDVGFLLDSRIFADGLLVLHNGRILVERYRNGLHAEEPRLLLQATRPLLALLGVISIDQGKLAADKSVSRFIPTLHGQVGLRKLSIQRLLQAEERHTWSADELEQWRKEGGWTSHQPEKGIRSWLSQPGRWDKPLVDRDTPTWAGNPNDDLLAWVLAESNATPLASLFCEQLWIRSRPEHPILWLTDPLGIELAEGLGLSLRDFGRLGLLLLEARTNRNRSKIPRWFIETLTASSGIRSPELTGLPKGSEQRYGFIHLGGKPNRVAIVGSHGTSLYVDFDHRLVVALYATYPPPGTPALLAMLEQFWKIIDKAIIAPGKR